MFLQLTNTIVQVSPDIVIAFKSDSPKYAICIKYKQSERIVEIQYATKDRRDEDFESICNILTLKLDKE